MYTQDQTRNIDSTIGTTTLYNMNDTLIQDDKLIGDLDHILQYLSNFEPLSTTDDENSDGDLIPMNNVTDQAETSQQQQHTVEEVMTKVVDPAAITTLETTPQQQEKHYTIEEDYFHYRGRGQGVHRSEIKQFSEIIEEKWNASSSFIMIYNNVHNLKEAVVFDGIMDFYFKPTVESDDSLPFLKFLPLRQVCKHWKRMIDEKYGRNFILSKLQDRVTYRYCPPNAEFYVFRIPIQLTIVACWWPSWLADKMRVSGKVQAYALGLSCFLTYMIVGGNPMLVPVGVLGYIVDLAIESILSQRDPIQEISLPKRVLNRYDRIEYNIMNDFPC